MPFFRRREYRRIKIDIPLVEPDRLAEPRPDHASYVASWLRLLDGDRRAIFQAAAHAQCAVAYLHGLQPQAETGREAA